MALDFIAGYVLGQRGAARAAGMASSAATFAASPTAKIQALDDRIDRLMLVVESMWSLLEESGFTTKQLIERIKEIDGTDGAVDGEARKSAGRCSECGAMLGRGLEHCQFCGHPTGVADPFRQV
ncbi:MAG: hypothetical protein OEM81_15085 [Acidimicrobiia bacterium]|nr:hypothetical protein [Acidimicrobiia bacterium]